MITDDGVTSESSLVNAKLPSGSVPARVKIIESDFFAVFSKNTAFLLKKKKKKAK